VAFKFLHGGCDAADRRRFDNEIHTLAGLSHPVLVSV
jgi:eukaryotic-like serine/threonine-protein kinase